MHPGSVQNHGNGLDPAMADHGIGLKAHFIGFPLASHPAAEGRAPCTSCACSSTAECRNIDFPHKATTKRLMEPSAPISQPGWSGGFYAAMRQTLFRPGTEREVRHGGFEPGTMTTLRVHSAGPAGFVPIRRRSAAVPYLGPYPKFGALRHKNLPTSWEN